ncbi:UDP-glucose--hexose-1-phosphate uridylyltransferase [Bacillus alkalicellulosilyticus]|uniref:UDP-glucose--hexose-1-phosphate uridylyltransferase n=1 Tax=Alkalihalobacterium alkalicellulosilyticum TaxID=1912214 RepID=UPI0009976833|nr:UDP-glucose--hexose-1-phosphate uridylyltransferase [Bacillus alkalicellulosilyticus]
MRINIYEQIERLIQYGIQKKMVSPFDREYVRNRIVRYLELDEYVETKPPTEALESPYDILEQMLDWANEAKRCKENTVTFRDLFDTGLMDCIMPRPSEINYRFKELYAQQPSVATSFFYDLSQNSHYIRRERIEKNQHWLSSTEYGNLEITINLSKPEKDPVAIAAAKNMTHSSYPTCLLCKENVGYQGRVDHPARQNHRIIPVTLNGEQWFFQFSPYVYYNEHAIIFSEKHEPMKISKKGFDRLLSFVAQFPHYFVGTNADLPIVGGSILSHDHFQGGNHPFPMAKAPTEESFSFTGFEEIEAGIVKWPMSVIRLKGSDRQKMSSLAEKVLHAWYDYSDESVNLQASTAGERHNTITPIARFRDGKFEFDLVLRNNRTSEQHPMGIFHPHDEVHHIKKENIGLIEVMGLAVLPGRLQEEMELLSTYLCSDEAIDKITLDHRTNKHKQWAEKLQSLYTFNEENVGHILQQEVGKVFSVVLEHAGVFKRTNEGKTAFLKFITHVQQSV